MTKEPRIIDGVDVSDCKYLYNDDNLCKLGKGDFVFRQFCRGNNCYYKQLKRKEQECEELKSEQVEIKKYLGISRKIILERLKELTDFRDKDRELIDQLKQECDELKKEGDFYSAEYTRVNTQLMSQDAYILIDGKEVWSGDNRKLQQQLDQIKAENEKLRQYKASKQASYESMQREWNNAVFENRELKAENKQAEQKLERIRDIAEPYRMVIKKICKNCEKYDGCHACCYKDINCYKYTSPNAKACDEFTYLDKFIPNIISNQILQIIDEVE